MAAPTIADDEWPAVQLDGWAELVLESKFSAKQTIPLQMRKF